jgi:myosin-5
MEKLRSDRLNASATMIQKNIRRFLARLHYLRVQKMALMLQSIARRKMAIREMELLRKEKAAIVIQKNWRRYVARKKYLQTRAFIIKTQAGKKYIIPI